MVNFYNQLEGKDLKNYVEFDKPFSVSITPVRNRIYICDFKNHRIQCLNSNLTFNSFILDIPAIIIHCTSDEIIVLKAKSPCISFYDYSHQLVREILPMWEGAPISLPCNFYVDHRNNILIIDYSADCVVIFSNNGERIHKFGQKGEGRGDFINPSAIALDSEDRIIVASKTLNIVYNYSEVLFCLPL